jgi:hypothetical protein
MCLVSRSRLGLGRDGRSLGFSPRAVLAAVLGSSDRRAPDYLSFRRGRQSPECARSALVYAISSRSSKHAFSLRCYRRGCPVTGFVLLSS